MLTHEQYSWSKLHLMGVVVVVVFLVGWLVLSLKTLLGAAVRGKFMALLFFISMSMQARNLELDSQICFACFSQ